MERREGKLTLPQCTRQERNVVCKIMDRSGAIQAWYSSRACDASDDAAGARDIGAEDTRIEVEKFDTVVAAQTAGMPALAKGKSMEAARNWQWSRSDEACVPIAHALLSD
jgi:hypothetical protein